MIKSFRQFNEDNDKEVFFTFGRFNPPTTGHQKLLDKIASVAKGNDYKVFASVSNDPKKNPLEYKEKIRFMRKMYPKHARSIVMNNKVNNALQIASELHKAGYNKITMVVGGDRVKEFDTLLKKYNDKKARHGYYNFVNGINVVSAGERDPDAEGVTGMSASKMRAAATDGDQAAGQALRVLPNSSGEAKHRAGNADGGACIPLAAPGLAPAFPPGFPLLSPWFPTGPFGPLGRTPPQEYEALAQNFIVL